MTDNPNLEDRPLVTFALFAYNQEKYIREAVEGAFSQTYSPLEIILSDDCSSDRTFEIMQEMAAAYAGPHEVRVRRSEENLGTIDHVITVATEAAGELLVVAAGDDVSMPARSKLLAQAWNETDAMALYSNCTTINDSGDILEHNSCHCPSQRTQDLFAGVACAKRYGGLVRNIPGYSAAYIPDVFRGLPKNNRRALNEDALTTIIVNVSGGHIEHVRTPLLRYRASINSTSPDNRIKSVKMVTQSERKIAAFAKSSSIFYPYVCKIVKERHWPAKSEEVNKLTHRLERRARISKVQSDVWEAKFVDKIWLALIAKDYEVTKILVARLFGLEVFSVIKVLYLRCRGKLPR